MRVVREVKHSMEHSFRRLLLHGTLILCASFVGLAAFPGQADAAGCYNGRCPSGEYDDSDARVEVNITLHVSPEDAGYIEVNGKELTNDVYVAYQGDSVKLEAVAERGYEFDGWTGSLSSDENPWETPFYNHKQITANFVPVRDTPTTRQSRGLAVEIPEDTEALGPDGEALDDIDIRVITAHDIPDAMVLVSRVYEVTPSGATFDPPITLSLEYDEDSLLSGADVEEFEVAWFDEEAGTWSALESNVDEDEGVVTTDVAHFSEFCVLSPAPAAVSAGEQPTTSPGFSLSGLTVTPASAAAGENVNISVIANYSGSSVDGVSNVALRVDGIVVDEQQVTLPSGQSASIDFSYVPSAEGPHEVDVNGLQAGLSVTVSAAPAALSQAVALAQQSDSFELPAPSISSFSWLRGWQPTAVVITAIVVVLLLLLPMVRRRILRYRYDI